MAAAGLPDWAGHRGKSPGEKAANRAEHQARIDWLLSEDDPWAELEEEPPCFCTAYLVHRDFDAVRSHLSRHCPELRTVYEEEAPPYLDLEWPLESFAWPEWLDKPPSFRGGGEVRLGQRFMEIWTPTRSRMRRLLRALLLLEEAQIEIRGLEVEDPLEKLAGRLEEGGGDEDLNPDLDSDAFEFLVGFEGPEPDETDGEALGPWPAPGPSRN